MSYRSVENFKFTEEDRYVEDGIQFCRAHHATTNLPYLLKKVSTNNDSKSKYKSLLNEIGLLKMLNLPSIVQCHKMLKTSNNIYLVYDYCDGSPLSECMKSLSRQTKLNIVNQIIDVLKLMANASIVHCSLKPSFIIVSNDKKIKIMNFIYGIDRSKNKKCIVQFRPPQSKYIAPEVLNDGIANQKTDFYSLGVILEQMNLAQQKGNFLEVGNSTNQIPKLIQMLLSQNSNERPNLEDIQSMLKGQTIKTPTKSQNADRSPTNSLRKNKSNSSNQENTSKKLILSPISASSDFKGNQKKFVEQVLKRRNLAIFLLQMSKTCLKIQEEQSKLSMFLSYIFLKKSSKIICGLLNFLKGQKGFQRQIQKVILDKAQRINFEKKPDFYKIISTIRKYLIILEKEAGNQKRWLDDIYRDISPQYPTKLKQLSPDEQTSDKALTNYVNEFLIQIIQKGTDQLPSKIAQNLYLMSQIISHKSYEKMFEQMISEEKISLDQQYLYIHIRKMEKKQLFTEIQSRVKVAS